MVDRRPHQHRKCLLVSFRALGVPNPRPWTNAHPEWFCKTEASAALRQPVSDNCICIYIEVKSKTLGSKVDSRESRQQHVVWCHWGVQARELLQEAKHTIGKIAKIGKGKFAVWGGRECSLCSFWLSTSSSHGFWGVPKKVTFLLHFCSKPTIYINFLGPEWSPFEKQPL